MYMRGGFEEENSDELSQLLRRMPRHKPTSARSETTQLPQTFSHDVRRFNMASNKIDKKIPAGFLCNTTSGRRRDNLGFYVFVSLLPEATNIQRETLNQTMSSNRDKCVE